MFEFLKDVRDSEGHPASKCLPRQNIPNVGQRDGVVLPDHPDYDSRTLLVPNKYREKMTPFEKQFVRYTGPPPPALSPNKLSSRIYAQWDIKKNHYDTILFFQKGKFYELYEDGMFPLSGILSWLRNCSVRRYDRTSGV